MAKQKVETKLQNKRAGVDESQVIGSQSKVTLNFLTSHCKVVVMYWVEMR
jgi:hypothetical protein